LEGLWQAIYSLMQLFTKLVAQDGHDFYIQHATMPYSAHVEMK
jgi:hypothetical protein